MATHYARAEPDKLPDKRVKNPVQSKLYDARSKCHHISMESVMKQVTFLKTLQNPPPFSYTLEDQEESISINTAFGKVPIGACLAHQFQDLGRQSTVL